jgi:cytochrome b subunit of formate dehydrogenase
MTKKTTPHHAESYPRFRIGARIEHFILMVSFTVLGLTGLPQKFSGIPWVEGLINALGGIELLRTIHHGAAFVLVAGSIYHLFTSAYRFFVKHERMAMIPTLKDAYDIRDTVRHNLGMADKPPKMAKFNFGEKFEYWAVVWGTAIMTLTGFILWNPIAFTSIFPGTMVPVAKAAHGGEALLAVLAIIVWHMYNVHIRHFNPSIFTGRIPRHIMEEEHALELERLEAGGKPWPELDLPVLQQRRRVFMVVAVIAGGLMLAGLYWAFTFEETAITTLPAVTREIFVPVGTPGP